LTALPNRDFEQLKSILEHYPDISVGAVFGSFATSPAGADSDIDVAVQAARQLTVEQRIRLIEDIALAFDRPVDLVDLRTAGQPLLHQILSSGRQLVGTRWDWGDLMFRNIMENEDFVPYQQRILEGRRKRWIDS
jgi:predicted nucleotidyltransferase